MIWWVLWLAVVTVLSYLADAEILPLVQNVRIPGLNASVMSLLLLLTVMGLINRMQTMKKLGEKESLAARVHELEAEIAALKAKTP